MVGRTDAGGANIETAGVLPGLRNESAQRAVCRTATHGQDVGELTDPNDGVKVFDRIKGQFLEQRHTDRGGVGQERERVAVVGGEQHRTRRSDSTCTGLIVDHHRGAHEFCGLAANHPQGGV